MNDPEAKEFYSPKELQRWLGVGRTKIFEILNAPDGEGIPHHRIGRKIVVRRRDVETWLEERRYPVSKH